ncbi:hypothetical protein MMC18_006434 [Xylographa bjoerkii]|nr:hypothetical protein [Xylographa bjoerkii]
MDRSCLQIETLHGHIAAAENGKSKGRGKQMRAKYLVSSADLYIDIGDSDFYETPNESEMESTYALHPAIHQPARDFEPGLEMSDGKTSSPGGNYASLLTDQHRDSAQSSMARTGST